MTQLIFFYVIETFLKSRTTLKHFKSKWKSNGN